jgi:hypothetical protein
MKNLQYVASQSNKTAQCNMSGNWTDSKFDGINSDLSESSYNKGKPWKD